MSALPGWHPMVVHFPLALVLAAAALLFAARLLRSETLAATAATVGTWNLCMGAIAAVFALGTGLAAVLDLELSEAARRAISLHMKWAMFTTLLLVLLAVWRGAGTLPGSRPSRMFLIVLSVAAAALIFTGYRGGMNVYEYGVGVKKIAVRLVRPPGGQGRHTQESSARLYVMCVTFTHRQSCRSSRTLMRMTLIVRIADQGVRNEKPQFALDARNDFFHGGRLCGDSGGTAYSARRLSRQRGRRAL
jgi:uncharacterized membrane protein